MRPVVMELRAHGCPTARSHETEQPSHGTYAPPIDMARVWIRVLTFAEQRAANRESADTRSFSSASFRSRGLR